MSTVDIGLNPDVLLATDKDMRLEMEVADVRPLDEVGEADRVGVPAERVGVTVTECAGV